MIQCDICGKWFHLTEENKEKGAIIIAPEHDCPYDGPTNPYKEEIEKLNRIIAEQSETIALLAEQINQQEERIQAMAYGRMNETLT